ncbi:MAG TPA: TadE family protein [Lichenihabitans sp.]|jgi:Flp pilus assembly protein TadG|nr:TadE family protein [Lichenihabitans sp.]
MKIRWRDFSAAKAGSAAVEFAFVGGVAIFLVIEAMQTGFYFFVSASLDRATTKAARQILTGGVSGQGLTALQFRSQVLCPLLPSLMPCANVVTNIQTVPEGTSPNGFYSFVKSDQSGIIMPTMDNNKTSYCIGTTGSYVYIQVFYAMPTMSPAWTALSSASWNGSAVHFVGAYAAFKNEPFQGSAQGSC